MENTQEQRICKTCNKPFSITNGELEWLKEHKLLPFTHCSSCRKARKKARKMKEKAAKEDMKMANKITHPEVYLDMAHAYAKCMSGCTKVVVGSAIVNAKGLVIAFGANAAIPDLCHSKGCLRIEKYGNNAKSHRLPSDCRAIHSEVNAICHLKKSAKGCTIFVTRYPCEACARAIVAAGIDTVYYGRQQEISEQTEEIFRSAGVNVYHLSSWDAEDATN